MVEKVWGEFLGDAACPKSGGKMTSKGENMLVLSRMKNESIIIDDDIKVTIVDIRGDKVRLSIEASKEIPVHREEIWLKIQKQDQEKKENENGECV